MKRLIGCLLFVTMPICGWSEEKETQQYSQEQVKKKEAEDFVKKESYPKEESEEKYRDVYLILKKANGEGHELTVKALWLLSTCQINKANFSVDKREEHERLLRETLENAKMLEKITKSTPQYKKEYEAAVNSVADVQIHKRQYEEAINTLSELVYGLDQLNDQKQSDTKNRALVKLCSLYARTGNLDKEKETERATQMAPRIKEVKNIPAGEYQINEKWAEDVKNLLKIEKRDLALDKILQKSDGKDSFQIRGAIKQVILCQRPKKEPIFILLCRDLYPSNANFNTEEGRIYIVDSEGKNIPSTLGSLERGSFIGDVMKNGYAQIVRLFVAVYIDGFGENKTNPQGKEYKIIDIRQVDESMPLVLRAKNNKNQSLFCKNDDSSEYPKIDCYENDNSVGSIFYISSIGKWRSDNNWIWLLDNPQWRSPMQKACPSRYEEIANEAMWDLVRFGHIIKLSYETQVEEKDKSEDPEDKYILGSFYSRNINGMRKNIAKGAELLEAAAEKGHARAQYELGALFLEGNGVTKSEETAVKWFLKASVQSVGDAQVQLNQIFKNGQGEAKFMSDIYKNAFAWLLSQAEMGNSEMQEAIAMSFYNGNSVEKNEKDGLKWMTAAADNGNDVASLLLGQFYMEGSCGAEKNVKKALEEFLKSAETGNPTAANYVGDYYLNEAKTDSDLKEAFKWYCKAAKNDSPASTLADCYFFGEGVAKDEKEAVKYYLKTAESGDWWSQYMLGNCFKDGIGVVKNEEESQKWFNKANAGSKGFIEWSRTAPEQLDPQTQYLLGRIYIYGIGTEKNEEEAAKWFRKAAENGNRRAQIALQGLKSEKGKP